MNKQELIKSIATEMEIPQNKAAKALNGVITAIGNALASGENVNLVGFGNFVIKPVEERTTRNPTNGEPITVPAHKKVSFKASSVLKEAVR